MQQTQSIELPSAIEARQAALARAGRLTSELIELVGQLRAALGVGEEQVAPESPRANPRLRSGDLRAAMSLANRRSTRQVPHLLGS